MSSRAALIAPPPKGSCVAPPPFNGYGAQGSAGVDKGASWSSELAFASTMDDSSSSWPEAPDTDDDFEWEGADEVFGMPAGGWPDTDDDFGFGGYALQQMSAARCGWDAPPRRTVPAVARPARGLPEAPALAAAPGRRRAAAPPAAPASATAWGVPALGVFEASAGAAPRAPPAGGGGARAAECAEPGDQGAETTLMIRNIPSDLSQQELISRLDSSGYAGSYNFLHVPVDFDTRQNRGHAFVNFDRAECAGALAEAWHGQHLFPGTEARGLPPLNIAPSSVQGLQANMKRWGWSRYRRVRTAGFRPFVRGMEAPGTA